MEPILPDSLTRTGKLKHFRKDELETQTYSDYKHKSRKIIGMKHIHSSTPWQPKKVPNVTSIINILVIQLILFQVPLVSQIMSAGPLVKENISTRKICHGITKKSWPDSQGIQALKNHNGSFCSLETIFQPSNNRLWSPRQLLEVSLCPNENQLPKRNPSISTLSSAHSTILLQLKKMLDAWDWLKSALDPLSWLDKFTPVENGHQSGTQSLKQLHLSSLINHLSSKNMGITSTKSSPQKSLKLIKRLSSMTPLSGPKLEVDKTCYSLTGISSNTCTWQLSCLMELSQDTEAASLPLEDELNPISAIVSTPQMVVPTMHQPAAIAISAHNASSVVILNPIAIQERERLTKGLQPKYLRYNSWTASFSSPCMADWTVNATP